MEILNPLAVKVIAICATIVILVIIYAVKNKWFSRVAVDYGNKRVMLDANESKDGMKETQDLCAQFEQQIIKMEDRHGQHLMGIEKLILEDKENREKRQADIDRWQAETNNRLDEMGENINKIFEIIEENEEKFAEVNIESLKHRLFDTSRVAFVRLLAFRELLALGENGRVWEVGYMLVMDNKEDWLNVEETRLKVEIVDEEYYRNKIGEIERIVYDRYK